MDFAEAGRGKKEQRIGIAVLGERGEHSPWTLRLAVPAKEVGPAFAVPGFGGEEIGRLESFKSPYAGASEEELMSVSEPGF